MTRVRRATRRGGLERRDARVGRGGGVGRDAGAAAVTTVIGAVLATVLTLVVLQVAADLGTAAARARTAADAAALAGMAESPLVGGRADPCVAAARLAHANGADILRCDPAAGWPLRIEVDVAVAPRTAPARALLPRVEARASAAVRPRTPRTARP